MNRLFWLGVLAIASGTMFGSVCFAADEKGEKPKTLAVIVGLGTYADPQIKPRATAVADAQAFYDLLTDKTVGGLPANQVQLLITGKDEKRAAKEATKEAILQALRSAVASAGKDDTLLTFIVGQGASAGDRTCIFASDSTFKDRAKNGLFASEIELELKTVKAQQICALLDFNLKAFEAEKTDTVVEPNIMDVVRSFLGIKEKQDDQEPPVGRVVILSGSGTHPPLTDGTNGIFAKAVFDAFRGKADKEGYEADGLVTVDELIKYLDLEVPNLARKFGKTPEEQQQLAVAFNRFSHFPLSRNPEVWNKAADRLTKFAALEKSAKLTPEVSEEGTRLLSRMPKLKAMQELRKSYQKFADGELNVEQLTAARNRTLEGLKLPSESAQSFAVRFFAGLEKFQFSYIKELNVGEMTAQGIRGLYQRAEEKIAPELQEQLGKAKELKKADLIALMQLARIPLGKREDLEDNKDVEIAIQAGIRKFVDDYTTYIDKDRVEEMKRDVNGSFTGIGVQIRRDLVRDGLLVVTPIKGSPAHRAGLLTGDLITKIRREVDSQGKPLDPPQEVSTKGMKVTDAVKLILGQPGTKVKVLVERDGFKEPKEFELTRGVVEVESVYGFKRKDDDTWDYYIDPKNKIAYIHLTQFARRSAKDMTAAVKQLDKEGVKGLILDVRNNPGGFLDVARDICDLFIDDGLIVTIRPRVGREVSMRGQQDPSYLNFPMVCLVNGGSASGSEILSACLQDHGRAVIMGERSYGKGSVQNIQDFPTTGGEIKVTTATFWRPNNKNLNKASTKGTEAEDWGVRPDKGYTLKLERQESDELSDRLRDWGIIPRRDAPPTESKDPKEKKEFKDRQLEMALDYLKNQIKVSGPTPSKKEG